MRKFLPAFQAGKAVEALREGGVVRPSLQDYTRFSMQSSGSDVLLPGAYDIDIGGFGTDQQSSALNPSSQRPFGAGHAPKNPADSHSVPSPSVDGITV